MFSLVSAVLLIVLVAVVVFVVVADSKLSANHLWTKQGRRA